MAKFSKYRLKILLWCLIIGTTVLIICLFTWCLLLYRGIIPHRNVMDYDYELTQLARSAAPSIKSTISFHDKYGRYPSETDLRELTSDPRVPHWTATKLGNSVASSNRNAWMYGFSPDEQYFELQIRFTDLQALIYHYDGKKGIWQVYDENTGSDHDIKLNP